MRRLIAAVLILSAALFLLTSCSGDLYKAASSIEVTGISGTKTTEEEESESPVTDQADGGENSPSGEAQHAGQKASSPESKPSANTEAGSSGGVGVGEQRNDAPLDLTEVAEEYGDSIKDIMLLIDAYGEEASAEYGDLIMQSIEDDIEPFLNAMVVARDANYEQYKQALVWVTESIARGVSLNGEGQYVEIIDAAKELPLSESAKEMLQIVAANVDYWITYG